MTSGGVIPSPEDRESRPREIGQMHSRYLSLIRFGIDGTEVSIAFGNSSVLLGPVEREQFMRLWCEAERQAEATMPP